MDSEDLLSLLADIHTPEPVPWWPPAPGWWALAALAAAAAWLLAAWLLARRRRRRSCRSALLELERCYLAFADGDGGDAAERTPRYLNGFNAVLRRVAMVHFPEARAAGMGGGEWVDFIREKGDASRLDEAMAEALRAGRFRARCEADVDAVHGMGRDWITGLYLRRGARPAARKTAD